MPDCKRIALVTDFGVASPYIGQMRVLLAAGVPELPVIDLISDLPPFRPDLAAYLLPGLIRDLPSSTLFLTVVDPGVGGERRALAIAADDNLFLGPDNGLLAMIALRSCQCRVWRLDWRPARLSATFQGRDLFAPAAIALARGEALSMSPLTKNDLAGSAWQLELPRVVYQDAYGNLMLGIRAGKIARTALITLGRHSLAWARTFSAVPPGQAFWYENAFGLVELAVNQGSAAQSLGLRIGDPVTLVGTHMA
jgi:S-adenosylmethionine hydrolase